MRILIYPHEVLSTKSRPVQRIDGALQRFMDQMIETMYQAKGLGLAANQVGETLRLFVMDVSPSDAPPNPIVVINPVITHAEGQEVNEEGCLSLPNYSAKVKRAARVQVKGYDRHGKEIVIEGEGIVARCLQHEIDHLDGICFVDRLSAIKKALFRKKWAKIRPELQDKIKASKSG